MVQRVFNLLFKEVRGLHQAAYILAILTFGSQLLALVRDRLLAHEFGGGATLDLYYAAFRIPDILFVLFASTLSVYVLIPYIAERSADGTFDKARALLSQIFTLFAGVYSVVALIIAILLPYIIPVVFPGFNGDTETLVWLTRLLLLQPFLLGISGIYAVVSQLQYRFVLYAITPLLYNLGIIFGVIFLYPLFGVYGLGLGVVLGALAHMLVQFPFVRESGLMPRFTTKLVWSELSEVLRTSLSRAFTLSLQQLVLLALVGYASVMTVGSISRLQLAFNLQSVPLAIIGVSYSVAAFPALSKLYASGKYDAFAQYLMNAIRHIIFWSIPVLALLIVVRAQFVRTVLGSGQFDWTDTRITAAALALFAISLLAQTFNLLITRALYAVGNTRIPLFVTLFSASLIVALVVLFNTLFVSMPAFRIGLESLFRVSGVPGTEVLTLPLAYTIGTSVGGILILLVSARALYLSLRELIVPFTRALCASVLGGTVAYGVLNAFATTGPSLTGMQVFIQGAVSGILGLATVILVYFITRSPELHDVATAIHQKLFKAEPALEVLDTPRD